jgi:hypothetical protein
MANKMQIYIRVESDDGIIGWWTFDRDVGESYICQGKELWGYDSYGYEYCRGTPCTSIKEAKARAKVAVSTANFDGDPNPKATFWKYVRGKLTKVKI